jgi:hypothetical protein
LLTEPITIIEFFTPILLNNPLKKHAVTKELVYHIIDAFPESLSSNDSLDVYISADNRIRLVWDSLIKVLPYNLSKLDTQLAYTIVSDEYFKVSDEKMQLKKEYGYPNTFDEYEDFLLERQKILTKRFSKEMLDSNLGGSIQFFEYQKYVIRQNELDRIFCYLVTKKFIHKGESLIDFKAIFNNRFNKMIRWEGFKNELVYFIFLLRKKGRLAGEYTRPIVNSFIYTDKNRDIQKEANYLKNKMSQYNKGTKYPKSALFLEKILEYLEN